MPLDRDQTPEHLIDCLAQLSEDLDAAGEVAFDAPEGQPDPGDAIVELPAQLGEQ